MLALSCKPLNKPLLLEYGLSCSQHAPSLYL